MKTKKIIPAFFILFLILILFLPAHGQREQNKSETLPKVNGPNLTFVGNWPFGTAIAVAKDTIRDVIYLGSGGAVLILNVANPANPLLVNDKINTNGLVQGLSYDPERELLYIAARFKDLQIWDVHDLNSPAKLIQFEHPYADAPMDNVDHKGNIVVVDCDYAYVNSFDVTDPLNPFWVDVESIIGNPAFDISIASDGFLHAVGAQNYIKIDIQSDGTFNTEYFSYSITGGNLIFGISDAAFKSAGSYLSIINTQSYQNPIWSITEVGFADDIFVLDNYLYLTVMDRLDIYDVSDYSAPYQVGSLTLPGYPKNLEVIDDYAYVADGHSGLRNIDISIPDDPKEVGFYETYSASYDFRRSGNFGFVAELDDGVLVFDLTDISNPVLVSQYNTPGYSFNLEIAGNLMYVSDRQGGLRIADISDPLNPVEVGFFDDLYSAGEVWINNNYAYIVDDILNEPDWIRVVDISDPSNPFEVSSILMQSEIGELETTGNYLYAASKDEGLRVLDISDPSNIHKVGQFLAPDVYDLCIKDNYVYLASSDFEGGVIILDISDPVNPEYVSNWIGNGWMHPFDIDVEGEYAYVTDPVNNVFLLLYIGDPEYPSLQGYSVMSGDLVDIYAQDSLVYISDGAAGLHIFQNDIFSTPGAGIKWEQQVSGTSDDLWAISFADTINGMTVGNNGTILKTEDAGENWQPQQSNTLVELFGVFYLNANTAFACGREGTILKTTNGGQNWEQLNTGTTNVFRDICFVDEDYGWAAGQDGLILHTTDGGENWETQITGINDYLNGITFTDYENGWVGGWDGKVLRTTNGGSNWQTTYTPSSADIYSLCFINNINGYAVTADVEVYMTTDGGNNWTEQYNNPSHLNAVLTDIFFVDSINGYSVGNYGEIISTSNGGEHWYQQNSGVQTYLTSVCITKDGIGWAVGKEGMILKSEPISIITENEKPVKKVPGEFVLFNNYPNPFNPSTTISFQLPATSFVSLKIYDVTGKEVETIFSGKLKAGIHQYKWNAKGLASGISAGGRYASGVYFYRLQTETNSITKKMILLR
jgi:photosystem II stability/assembly factor-like uncharacterized protein